MSRTLLVVAVAVLLVPLMGCGHSDERLARLAEQSLRQQAEQNREMSELNHEVTQTHQELIGLQHDLEGQQAEVNQQRDQLESERREIAGQRYRDPIIAAAITGLGVVMACLAPIVLAIYLLRTVHHQEPSDAELAELLVREIASDQSVLFGPSGRDQPFLGHEGPAPKLPPASAADPDETERSQA